MSFHFYHLASLLHTKGSCLYPLPLALNVKPRSRKEADIRKFFPWLEVPVAVHSGGKKAKTNSGRGALNNFAKVKTTVHMPMLRKLAANPHTELTRDWVKALSSVANTSNAGTMLKKCGYDEDAKKYLEKLAEVKVSFILQSQSILPSHSYLT